MDEPALGVLMGAQGHHHENVGFGAHPDCRGLRIRAVRRPAFLGFDATRDRGSLAAARGVLTQRPGHLSQGFDLATRQIKGLAKICQDVELTTTESTCRSLDGTLFAAAK